VIGVQAEDEGMQVHLLYLDGCPSRHLTRARLLQALRECGRPDTPVLQIQVSAPRAGAQPGFAGSPTITVDGVDLFGAPPAVGAWACRLYRTPDGLAGAPAVEDLVTALNERMGR
jgi:hypothetical protein